jgi:hypothetical protein
VCGNQIEVCGNKIEVCEVRWNADQLIKAIYLAIFFSFEIANINITKFENISTKSVLGCVIKVFILLFYLQFVQDIIISYKWQAKL